MTDYPYSVILKYCEVGGSPIIKMYTLMAWCGTDVQCLRTVVQEMRNNKSENSCRLRRQYGIILGDEIILKHSKRDAGRVKCGLGVITEKSWMVRVFQYG